MEEQTIITQVDPQTFDFQNYTQQDNILISSSELDTAFAPSTDYIEYYVYDENINLIFPIDPDIKAIEVDSFSVINGDTILYPDLDLEARGYDSGTFFSTYNFYRKLLGSSIDLNYYISEISSDRTELRLKSNTIPPDLIISSSNDFIQRRETSEYFVDFLLNFGYDQQLISNNIRLDIKSEIEPSILIKLYEPLPPQFDIKSTLWVVEEISTPQAYQVTFPFLTITPDDFQFIKGPNYSLQIKQEAGASGQLYGLSELINTNVTSSYNQLQSLLDRKSVSINVDYTDYKNFIHFSSAKTRLENFYYKVANIQSASLQLPSIGNNSSTYSSSFINLTTEINSIIRSFDGYEYFLYYNSGSQYSWPKSTSSTPYILYPTDSQEVKEWIGNSNEQDSFYGGQALIASEYDINNQDWLYSAIPEYLKTDKNNQKYELFVDMVAQQYDNTWLYTKDLTNRFNNDNRLDYGISKDLVAEAIKDFGIKLYSNNFNTDNLYTAFLGITPSGSNFPFPNMTDNYPAPLGFEYVNTAISASNDIVPLDDVNKSVYKRIYHNLPYLLKTKGTIAGLRALITSYGIPNTVLRINEFGGKDRKDGKDWDYSQNQFNYAFHLDGESHMESSFLINSKFQNVNSAPKALQFRFKTGGIPTSSLYQQIWVADVNTSFITLEYTGSGMTSGSYSGSIPSNYNQYATLKFYPDGLQGVSNTASISLPFFDGGWWSVMANVDYNTTETASLYAANRIGDKIGFSGSDHVIGYQWQYWGTADKSYFPSSSAFLIQGNSHVPLSGALQEVRYWDIPLEEPLFYDYTMNPYSTQGNTVNSTPDDLVFRAPLGTYLNTGSMTSIHPKVTGSWEITQSFIDNTSTYYFTGSFIKNTEEVFQNQVPGGIKNTVTEKIHLVDTLIPSGSTLSPFRSVQQSVYSNNTNPNINYLEVAFSPSDQVNDDIISQIGNFTLGDYIGDPRQISTPGSSYSDLDTLRDQYFTKYINSYNINDFIRLIKFFDNSLFKMIADFTPAKMSLSSGVVIKQNLLERNRYSPPQVSSAVTMSVYYTGSPSNPYSEVVALVQQDQTISGSVRTLARNYNLGSSDYPQYDPASGSSIYVSKGSTGGVFDPFNTIYNSPVSRSNPEAPYNGLTSAEISSSTFASQYPGVVQDLNEYVYTNLGNNFPMGSSYNQSNSNTQGNGLFEVARIDQREFYNGEFPSTIQVKLPETCKAFFGQDNIPDYNFLIQWFNDNSFPESTFLSPNSIPGEGNVWFWADTVGPMALGINSPLGLTPLTLIPLCTNGATLTTINYTVSSGFKTKGILTLVSTSEDDLFAIRTAYFTTPGSGYKADGFIIVPQAELIVMGFIDATGPVSFTIVGSNLSPTPTNKVKYIKMSDLDVNGIPIQPFIQESQYVIFNLTGASDYLSNAIEGYQTWYISNTTSQDDNVQSTTNAQLLIINQEPSSVAVSSFDTAFYDLTFSASGVFDYYSTQSGQDPNVIISSGVTSSIPQGYFPPVPSFPTESFFKGWASATYFQTNFDGTVSLRPTGSGYYYDPYGYKNFNIGKIEIDNDTSIPYTSSTIPWFINATASTLQVLATSSLVGTSPSGSNLYLYEGSITKSAVEISPTFQIYNIPPPTPALGIDFADLTGTPTATITIACGVGMNSFENENNDTIYIIVTSTDQTTPWTVSISYPPNQAIGWVSVYPSTGTGDGSVGVTVQDGATVGNSYFPRSATITITNDTNDLNNISCQVSQFYIAPGSGGGGYGPNII